MAPASRVDHIGIYIHVPFCSHICPYCDFNTYSGQDALIPAYVDAIVTHLQRASTGLSGRNVGSIYFGGGTPSLLEPEQIEQVLQMIRASFHLDARSEITLESNPNSVSESYFSGLLDAGVNRLSIGAQTFSHRGLRVLGRQHEASDVTRAVEAARRAGFDNLSLDLIYGWPEQTIAMWKRDIDEILALKLEHLSAYSLIVEPGTPMFEAVERQVMIPADEDLSADLYELLIDEMQFAGWHHYEISNWCRDAGGESRHNSLYWRNGEYLGIGAGAHGRIEDKRVMNHLLPATYVSAVNGRNEPISNAETITDNIAMSETMMLGLRLLDEGVTHAEFSKRHGHELNKVFDAQINKLVGDGLLSEDPEGVRLTARGMMLANDVCSRFL